MQNKKCSLILDFDGVLVPGEELMDEYVKEICYEASNAYCEILFKQQRELIQVQQQLEQERDIYGPEMLEIKKELEEMSRKLKRHFNLKDQVLEETEEQYRNRINYKEIYQAKNVYQCVLEILWQIHDKGIYVDLICNTHVNSEAEIIAKKNLLTSDFPEMIWYGVRYHVEPYRFNGVVNLDRKPSDKIGRLIKTNHSIDILTSSFIDNTASIIKRGKEIGLRCYYVPKNLEPYIIQYPTLNPIPSQIILRAANDTIDKVHDGKIKKLSL